MIRFTALLAVLALGGLAVAACGEDEPSGSGGAASTDRAFATAMIPHHESAIDMAEMAQERGESAFVRQLAENIISTQSAEIDVLRKADQRLADEGLEVGVLGSMNDMSMDESDTMETLRTADPFDEAFMEMMIEHHQRAVDMAKIEVAEGSDPELQGLAQDVIVAQEQEIADMRDRLAE